MDGAPSHCTEGGDQIHPQEKEMQKGKMVVWRGLQIAEKKDKGKDIPTWIQCSKE